MKKDKNVNCIFCKIIKKDIPCDILYEDKNFLAFLDIYPFGKGHSLLIPKKHFIWMQEADDKIISEIFKKAKKIMLAMKKGLKCDYVQVLVLGKDVPHFHIHLVPRKLESDIFKKEILKYEDKEKKEILKKIQKYL